MSSERYLSVKEVAEKTGLSQQAIYKRIKTDFKPFSTKLNGKLKLDKAVITMVTGEKEPEYLNQVSIESEYITFLKQQITLKDEQISSLSTALNQSQILLKLEQDKTVKMLEMTVFSTSLNQVENEGKKSEEHDEEPIVEKECSDQENISFEQDKKWWQFWK